MRKFSVRPTLTIRGRTFKRLRGWSGKPLHPPLTDVPVAAYILGVTFDVIVFVGQDEIWACDSSAPAHTCSSVARWCRCSPR